MVHYVKLSLLASSNSMALPWPGGLAGRVAMSSGVGGVGGVRCVRVCGSVSAVDRGGGRGRGAGSFYY